MNGDSALLARLKQGVSASVHVSTKELLVLSVVCGSAMGFSERLLLDNNMGG